MYVPALEWTNLSIKRVSPCRTTPFAAKSGKANAVWRSSKAVGVTTCPLGRIHLCGVNGEGGGAGSTKQDRNRFDWMFPSLSGRMTGPSCRVILAPVDNHRGNTIC